ncbi:DUF3179 domain-containing (seleno)protein [Pacificoceanicola onchidii]|uniref:DUF3179 domain-containing (seleno)protein n=1 Tax=Pacificoceanicola onchidii TaxID=2562685 RepID=UPI0010A69F06|nr:DUF3179 domain-containing (seleno)protein [Pacificoceanicola onchidii]
MAIAHQFSRGVVLSVSLLSAALFGVEDAQAQQSGGLPQHVLDTFGAPPDVPGGPLSEGLQSAIKVGFVDSITQNAWGPDQIVAMQTIAGSEDPRVAWIISDMLRFITNPGIERTLTEAAASLLQTELPAFNSWGAVTDHLMAWDIPAPPGYLPVKRAIFTSVVPGWDKLFVEGDIDWRHVSWGGVLIDDRDFDCTDEACNCIPAADNPEVSLAKDATWLDDDAIVFGVEVNGEYRAYPRRIMEVREMVNDTLGGRDLGIPYCTLCGAAQAYFTDQMPAGVERPVLRTSGLLIRSNKVMYDINTHSVFDTFLGKAVTGPLAERGLKLEQASVVTTSWGSWKEAHPETTVLVEALALGRDFDFRNTRDADGPIFPIGDVDPRLPVHEDIIGIVTASGTPIAFQRSKAIAALSRGEQVGHEEVALQLDAGGVRAVDGQGVDVGSHQAFWFAWSQFHPETALWP